MPASFAQQVEKHRRLQRVALLVGEHDMKLCEVAESMGITQQLVSKYMKELELKVFGFNEPVRRGRPRD